MREDRSEEVKRRKRLSVLEYVKKISGTQLVTRNRRLELDGRTYIYIYIYVGKKNYHNYEKT